MHPSAIFSFALSIAFAASATPLTTESAPAYQHFTSQNHDDVSLRFVNDSGICETTPGVHQVSGYLDVGKNMSMVCLLPTILVASFHS